LPYGGTLASAKCWLLLTEFINWQEPGVNYLPQLSANVVAPTKPVRLAFGSFYTKQQFGLTDEEADVKIQEKYYTSSFLDFSSTPARRHLIH